ncbi:MAG: WbqC family protein, partial [Chitinophagaceae bacterium]
VRIDYSTNWQQQHWRSIFSAYGNSPWFFHFAGSLEKLYAQKADYLVDWNFLCMDWVNRSLGVSIVPLQDTDVTFGKLGDFWEAGRLLESGGTFGELGDFWEVGGPLEGSANNESRENRKMVNREEGILDFRDRVLPANFQNIELGPFPVYTQVFEERFGFQPNLSILDFVLCCGKQQFSMLLK